MEFVRSLRLVVSFFALEKRKEEIIFYLRTKEIITSVSLYFLNKNLIRPLLPSLQR
jgi:hypothetical protein